MHFLRGTAIEVASGFIGEDERRLIDEGAGHCYPLLFAAAEFAGLVGQPVAQSEVTKQLFGAFTDLFRRIFLNKSRNAHVFQGREFGQQMVKLKYKPDVPVAKGSQLFGAELADRNTVDSQLAPVSMIEGAKDVQQRTFAGPGFANDADDLAWLYGKMHAFQDFELSV